jgi:hypothetical protein
MTACNHPTTRLTEVSDHTFSSSETSGIIQFGISSMGFETNKKLLGLNKITSLIFLKPFLLRMMLKLLEVENVCKL